MDSVCSESAASSSMPKAYRGPFEAAEAFQAAARPLVAERSRRTSGASSEAAAAAAAAPGGVNLAELSEGPYIIIAMMLDAASLCRTDATCRLLRGLNRANGGPWRCLGARAFSGIELDGDGDFELEERDSTDDPSVPLGRKHARVDWKGRFGRFRREIPTFRAPFSGMEIVNVTQPDEVAYCKCRLRTDLLDVSLSSGVYLEVEVQSNADNLSLAVVDFEAGGRSSVTFSPDTGAVIRERKVREAPRKVEGAYFQPLSTTPPGRRFEGSMGLFLHGGHLAFFRRCVNKSETDGTTEVGAWECTGFITDLTWAEGRCLTPCLAFRDEGKYAVRIVRVSSQPPQQPEKTILAYDDNSWSVLDWEAGSVADA